MKQFTRFTGSVGKVDFPDLTVCHWFYQGILCVDGWRASFKILYLH